MTYRLGLFFAASMLIGLTGCASSPGDSINDAAVYRAQDRAFRPMAD